MKSGHIDNTFREIVAGYHNDRETREANRQMLCRKCNREKSAK